MRGAGELLSIVGIFVLIFILWVSTGGPSRPISFSGPYLNPITTTGTTAQPYGDPTKFSSINTGVTVGSTGITVTNASSLRGTVAFSRDLTGTSETDSKKEYVVFSVSSSAKNPISTAGWKIVSKETGDGAPFPQGIETARSGRVNTLSPITLKGGDQVILVSGRSPVGVSFKENKCTGYLEERQDFRPALSLQCPTGSQEFAKYFNGRDENGACIAYIRTIPYCATETQLSGNASNACDDFIETYLNYNGCVATHEQDPDFLSTTWRVFLGSSDELWRNNRETITLLDAENKVIDSITY
jgi:hypothetical protein